MRGEEKLKRPKKQVGIIRYRKIFSEKILERNLTFQAGFLQL